MKKIKIKGGGIFKKKEIKRGVGMKEARKQAKIGRMKN